MIPESPSALLGSCFRPGRHLNRWTLFQDAIFCLSGPASLVYSRSDLDLPGGTVNAICASASHDSHEPVSKPTLTTFRSGFCYMALCSLPTIFATRLGSISASCDQNSVHCCSQSLWRIALESPRELAMLEVDDFISQARRRHDAKPSLIMVGVVLSGMMGLNATP